MPRNIEFHHGVKPNDPAKPRLKVGRYLTLPTAPEAVDYLTKVDNYPMYLNDRYGDCVFADIGHVIQAESTYGQGSTQTVSDADVIKGYSDVTGFDPSDPSTDNGTVIQEALDYWRKTGVGGHQILAFAEVDTSNMDEVRAALSTFGSLTIGFEFPDSAMDQFNRGERWDYVPGARIEGGHCVDGGLYGNGVDLKVVTWGDIQEMTQAFWDKYVFEAWVVITSEWLSAQGFSPTGLDLHGLGQELSELTGEPNPFLPAPSPTPGRGLVQLLRQLLATLMRFFKRS
jgi:hypothetical protein